jgi:hypothetical protein
MQYTNPTQTIQNLIGKNAPITAIITQMPPQRIAGTMDYQEMCQLAIVTTSELQHDNGTEYVLYKVPEFIRAIFPATDLGEICKELIKLKIDYRMLDNPKK